ncbi:hypothetical protein [Curtobacterium flaccumfaciens]|nr:hypothetical protein [Curtobacterium flaccumfaciens]
MTGLAPAGWDRSDPSEWATLPGPFTRWLMLRQWKKEMRTW